MNDEEADRHIYYSPIASLRETVDEISSDVKRLARLCDIAKEVETKAKQHELKIVGLNKEITKLNESLRDENTLLTHEIAELRAKTKNEYGTIQTESFIDEKKGFMDCLSNFMGDSEGLTQEDILTELKEQGIDVERLSMEKHERLDKENMP